MTPLHQMVLVLKIQRNLIHHHRAHPIVTQLEVAPKDILIQAPPHQYVLLLVNSTTIAHVSFIFIQVNIGQVLSFRWSVSVEFLKLPSSGSLKLTQECL